MGNRRPGLAAPLGIAAQKKKHTDAGLRFEPRQKREEVGDKTSGSETSDNLQEENTMNTSMSPNGSIPTSIASVPGGQPSTPAPMQSIDPAVQRSIDMQQQQLAIASLQLDEARALRQQLSAVTGIPSQVKTMTLTKKVLVGAAFGAGGFAALTGAVVLGNVLSRPRVPGVAKPVAVLK